MKTFNVLAVVALLAAGATSAAAQGVTLEFQGSGKVRLVAQNVPVSQILAEWSRQGRTTIVNGERVSGPPVTLELQSVSEQEALDIVLRNVSGYLVAAREPPHSIASTFSQPVHGPPPPPPHRLRCHRRCRCRTIRMTTRRCPTVPVDRTRLLVRGCRAT